MKKLLIITSLGLGFVSCGKKNIESDDINDKKIGEELKVEVVCHAIGEDVEFFGSANAVLPEVNRYMDVKVNGVNRGTMVGIRPEDFRGGKITIESDGKSKLLTVVYAITSNEDCTYSMFLFANDTLREVKTITVDSGVYTQGAVQLASKK